RISLNVPVTCPLRHKRGKRRRAKRVDGACTAIEWLISSTCSVGSGNEQSDTGLYSRRCDPWFARSGRQLRISRILVWSKRSVRWIYAVPKEARGEGGARFFHRYILDSALP